MLLAHQLVTAPLSTARPTRFIVFLHGILGSGANWRTFAKAVVAERPDWGALLVDLRLHGESREGFSTPHTIQAAASDVRALIDDQGLNVRALFGHSFGGKVALALAHELGDGLEHLFVIDSTPSARPDAKGSESTQKVVDLLGDLPDEFPDRASFTSWVEQRGVSRPIAMWLAMNVRALPNSTRFAFRLDLSGVRELLADYFVVDLWSALSPRHAHGYGEPAANHLIVGGESAVVDSADRERASKLPTTTVDVIPGAGHWVHVDAPDALRTLVVGYLS